MTKRSWAARACVFALASLASGTCQAGTLASPGCMAGGEPATVASVEDALDFRLGDGRLVRLAGIAVPEGTSKPDPDLAAWLDGRRVSVAPLRSQPDRWGRVPALVFAPPTTDPDRPVSVTEALLDAGRALARPDPALAACWTTAMQLERGAERDRRGLWATSPVLAPGDAAGLRARAGTLAIVDGRVATVREGRARTYLRFADDRGTGMAAALAPALVRQLVKTGMDPRDWSGHRLRVRGLVDDRWGWQIEVTDLQQLNLEPP